MCCGRVAVDQFQQEAGEAVHGVGRPAVGVVEFVGHRVPGAEHVHAGVDQVERPALRARRVHRSMRSCRRPRAEQLGRVGAFAFGRVELRRADVDEADDAFVLAQPQPLRDLRRRRPASRSARCAPKPSACAACSRAKQTHEAVEKRSDSGIFSSGPSRRDHRDHQRRMREARPVLLDAPHRWRSGSRSRLRCGQALAEGVAGVAAEAA